MLFRPFAALLLLLAVLAEPSSLTAAGDDPIVATVDGTEIRMSDVEEAALVLPDQYRQLPMETLFPHLVDRLIRMHLLAAEGEKQGLDMILDVAEKLERDKRLRFIILGQGLFMSQLTKMAENRNLSNLVFDDLVEVEDLSRMLNSSFVQLIIQKSNAAESFFPSKLTNILASGSASIVTAKPNTTLYRTLVPADAAIVIEPESKQALVEAILRLVEDRDLWMRVKQNGRKLAERTLGIDQSLSPILQLVNGESDA